MNEIRPKYDIGVIVGRFQTHRLHSEHQKLIEEVISRHDRVVLFLGCTVAQGSPKNPLDFVSRKEMIMEKYGDKISAILPLYNKKRDDLWSNNLDNKVREIFPLGSVVLYGSKDSFIPYYKGRFATCELEPENYVSATTIRDEVSKKVLKDEAFRAGCIYNAYNSFPIVYSTIDVAVMDSDETKVLLGRKSEDKEGEYRFIGGFVDVEDSDLTTTVKREAQEETGLEVGDIRYISSVKVEDWRYRGETNRSIMTHFHIAKKIFGIEKANDDIAEIKWFNKNELKEEMLVGEHRKLLIKLIEYYNK